MTQKGPDRGVTFNKQQQDEEPKKYKDIIDQGIFSLQDEHAEDMHLRLSEKYQVYKDLASRCIINPTATGKGDNRVFYLQPETIFLQDPRTQNQWRNEFIRQISMQPQPEPFTVQADDLHKALLSDIKDKSNPVELKNELAQFFQRRQYKLQHKRHKYLQRYSHFALTSEYVDKVQLKFSPNYSKIQFELENAVKRFQRLNGEDHFATKEKRPQRLEPSGEICRFDKDVEDLPKHCSLREDDLDVYTRIVSYEQKCNRAIERFLSRTKWTAMQHRFEIYTQAQEYFQKKCSAFHHGQKVHSKRMEQKAKQIIEQRKLGEEGEKELEMILNCQPHMKTERRDRNAREAILNKSKSTYDLPPLVIWNQLALKVELQDLTTEFGIKADMEVDNGTSFSYTVIVQFPTIFHAQMIKGQFAPYDAMPKQLNPAQLGATDVRAVLERNARRYGKQMGGGNTLLELLEIKKQSQRLKIEFLNTIELAIFGEFNNGQLDKFPKVRVKQSHWVPYICQKPEISTEQMHQASVLSSDHNPIDEVAAYLMEVVNVNDVTSVNLTLESLSQIHYDKVRYGQVHADFLQTDHGETESFFNQEEKAFLKLFQTSLKTKAEFGFPLGKQDGQDLPKDSLLHAPQQLLFSFYLLVCLKAREQKTKLLYVLNAFRSIQKRITLELREMGSRDRVLGDVVIKKPTERRERSDEIEDEEELNELQRKMGFEKADLEQASNIVQDEMVDLNRFRFNKKLNSQMYSTCPIVPKFHVNFGEPVDRQEVSSENEQTKDSDPRKGAANKLLGRVDKIEEHKETGITLVTDDFGMNVMYDSAFADMRSLEHELLKTASFYISKVEPLQDQDLRNILPAVDRFSLIQKIIEFEYRYQKAKLSLTTTYLECYEHTCDPLEQQRMIQIITDIMARRPRLNLHGNYFQDSYLAEIELLETQSDLMREFIKLQTQAENRHNTEIREYLESSYNLIQAQLENKWQIFDSEDVDVEVEKRRLKAEGVQNDEDAELAKNLENSKPGMFKAKENHVDPKEFAQMLGIPYSSLFSLMKEHSERDPLVKSSIHEHVSFIKLQEGYPCFVYNNAAKGHNKVRLTSEGQQVGILDFYESLSQCVRVVAMIGHTTDELKTVHVPENGFASTALDVVMMQFLLAELKMVRDEEKGELGELPADILALQDDSILGNSEQMLFYAKELVACAEDPQLPQNPFVMTKLDLNTVKDFDFDSHQAEYQQMTLKKDLQTTESEEEEAKPVQLDIVDEAYLEMMSLKEDEYERKRKLLDEKKKLTIPRLKKKVVRPKIPSMLTILCNGVEVMRLRYILVEAIHQRRALQKIYTKQMSLIQREGKIFFNEPMNLEATLPIPSEKWRNFVDENPSSNQVFGKSLAIKEFDPSLMTVVNFQSPDAFKATICPLGLEELRAVIHYELVNLELLVLATRTNQILLDNSLRKLAEIELFATGVSVANPVFDLQEKLTKRGVHESVLKKLPEIEKRDVLNYIQNHIEPHFYKIIEKKTRFKEQAEKHFIQIKQHVYKPNAEKLEVAFRELRTARVVLCNDYCQDILATVFVDALKLEMLQEIDVMRRRAYILPRESMVHSIKKPTNGEHEFAFYKEESEEINYGDSEKDFFYNKGTKKIEDFWRVPSYQEILTLEFNQVDYRQKNCRSLYAYKLGDPKSDTDLSEFVEVNQCEVIRRHAPKITELDVRQAEETVGRKGRFVDFKESFYCNNLPVTKYLFYFKQLSNLFDLELFQTKLNCRAKSIAGLEGSVLSGLNFWEESDESLFGSDSYEELDVNKMYSNEQITTKRNKMTEKVMKRVAVEKRQKVQLMQEMDLVKERFKQWALVMSNSDICEDVMVAGQFLNKIVNLNFASLLNSLQIFVDSNGKKGTAAKEVQAVNELISRLTHCEDQKVTYTNGFHVNHAVTATRKINLDENVFRSDYENFSTAIQPVINELAMEPPEFTLVKQLYLVDKINMRTYKKQKDYLGCLPKRDFASLDYQLLAIDIESRKHIHAQIGFIESQSVQYAHSRLNFTSAKQYQKNVNQQLEVFQERQAFMRQLVRSEKLKRVLLVLMGQSTIPTDSGQLMELCDEFKSTISWKVQTKMEEIDHQRIVAAEKNSIKRAKLQTQESTVEKLQKAIFSAVDERKQEQNLKHNDAANQSFDQANCEVEVYTREIQTYLIIRSQRMIDKEATSLAKVFEINGKRTQALIHPQQQFASTFEDEIDGRNHLDLINKVIPVQKMLTQFKNRCLEIETLTSGHGIVISSKDLNDCLHEFCRSVLKFGEIEMRSRCESLTVILNQYENLLYFKDQSILSLECKLKQAKNEINKIVNTKVFARGNNLIYELDFQSRQLRLMKDNIFNLEEKLKNKIHVYYEKDLEKVKVLLAEEKKKFNEYKQSLNAHVKGEVKEHVNNLEVIMKRSIESYKDTRDRKKDTSNDEEILVKYGHMFKRKDKDSSKPADLSALTLTEAVKIFAEMERIKESEREARSDVIKLQDFIRKQRVFQNLKAVLTKQKFDFKLDNMREQLSSNACLWEQLAEAEKREKILKQEIEKSQYEVATQERIIEQLKDDVKAETREKQKLQQYKQNKSKRLDELESKAKEFEVLENVNLQKLLQMIERKEKKIKALEKSDDDYNTAIDYIMRFAERKVSEGKRLLVDEKKVKESAIEKINELRFNTSLQQNEEESMTVEYWRGKHDRLKQEFEKLQRQAKLMSLPSLENFNHRSNTDTLFQESVFTSNQSPALAVIASKDKRSHFNSYKADEELSTELSVPVETVALDKFRQKHTLNQQSHVPKLLQKLNPNVSVQNLAVKKEHHLLPMIMEKDPTFGRSNFRNRHQSFGVEKVVKNASLTSRTGAAMKASTIDNRKEAPFLGQMDLTRSLRVQGSNPSTKYGSGLKTERNSLQQSPITVRAEPKTFIFASSNELQSDNIFSSLHSRSQLNKPGETYSIKTPFSPDSTIQMGNQQQFLLMDQTGETLKEKQAIQLLEQANSLNSQSNGGKSQQTDDSKRNNFHLGDSKLEVNANSNQQLSQRLQN